MIMDLNFTPVEDLIKNVKELKERVEKLEEWKSNVEEAAGKALDLMGKGGCQTPSSNNRR